MVKQIHGPRVHQLMRFARRMHNAIAFAHFGIPARSSHDSTARYDLIKHPPRRVRTVRSIGRARWQPDQSNIEWKLHATHAITVCLAHGREHILVELAKSSFG